MWLNFKNILTICQIPWANAFLYKYFRFSSLKRSKIRSQATSNNTFRSVVWNLQQENKVMLPARFEQATILLVEIDNSKPRRLAVCLGEERGLISWTAAGNRDHLPAWHKSLNHIIHSVPGGTPLFALYRYVPLIKAWFSRSWVLNRVRNLTIKHLEQGCLFGLEAFQRERRVVMSGLHLQYL